LDTYTQIKKATFCPIGAQCELFHVGLMHSDKNNTQPKSCDTQRGSPLGHGGQLEVGGAQPW